MERMKREERCPVCNSKHYRYVYYAEECYGIVEQHGYCDRCGYTVEQAYSEPFVGFMPAVQRGYHDRLGKWHRKETRKRKRMKRKFNIKYGSKDWMLQFM